MRETPLKYIFWALSFLLFVFLLFTSVNAGITCDEVLHYTQSQDVYNYFATRGEDKDALHNPVWHLMYYGQSYDNIVTILMNWLNIEDVYGFRHIMSSLAGWLTIMVTAIFSIWISGYRSAILVIVLFFLTPTFLGHSHNNLKDIPFALGYISATFLLIMFLKTSNRIPPYLIVLLTLSVAFTMSIRAAGAVLIFYIILFTIITTLLNCFSEGNAGRSEIIHKSLLIVFISFIAFFLSIMLWPYALQDPLRNVVEAYRIMAHFPDTFRQIFEGRVEWSDFMPWYYLPKSMLITVPVIVTAGILLFVVLSKRIFTNGKGLIFSFIIFTILFPVFFAILQKSNLYSSWRQFLFIYPAIVILAASGINMLFESVSNKHLKWILTFILFIGAIHPLRYMLNNPGYFYIYYNQLVGGLKGAYGNYETDYYYVSQTEASEWLINYLEKKGTKERIRVSATYSVSWQFRNNPEIETSYFRYEERSMTDWDYAIVTNRYVPIHKIKSGNWPPKDAIQVIYADSVPVCAVLERKAKDDYNGFRLLSEGNYSAAVKFFEKALITDCSDEMIFYNFAAVLYNLGEKQKADSLLKESLKLNPDFEPSLMYLGNIAKLENDRNTAITYYERVLTVNRKYFEAYVELAGLFEDQDLMRVRRLLRTCITINPLYKPAIMALADTYRKNDPEIASKYDKLAESVK